MQVTVTDYALAKVAGRRGAQESLGGSSSEVRQHGFLSEAQTRREGWALTASATARRADGVLDSELLRVWLR